MRRNIRRICYYDGYGDAHYATAYANASDAVETEWDSYAEDEEGFLGVISAKNNRGVRYWAIVPAGLGTNTDREGAESAEDWWDESFDHGEYLA